MGLCAKNQQLTNYKIGVTKDQISNFKMKLQMSLIKMQVHCLLGLKGWTIEI